jgi:2',3'-cyclic-nucleotide 2'-phosphodiesterase (5'-nucleotidase family)
MFRFLALFFVVFLWETWGAETTRILFTGNLEGQVSGCFCSKTPKSGLLKLRSFLEDYRKKYPDTLLVETGSFVSEKDDATKSKFLIEQLIQMKYDAMIFGPNEEEVDDKVSIPWKKLPIVSNSKKIPGNTEVIKTTNSVKMGFLGIVSRAPYKYTIEGYNSDHFYPEEEYLKKGLESLKSENTSLNVLLVHGKTGECKAKTNTPNIGLILCGHDGIVPTSKKEKWDNKIYYLQSGSLGNHVGEVIITFQKGKLVKLEEKVYDLLSMEIPDHPEIEDWLKKNPKYDERH